MNYVFDTSATVVLIETCCLGEALRTFGHTNKLVAPKRVNVEYMSGTRPERDPGIFEKIFEIVDVLVDSELLPYFGFDADCGEINVISYALHNEKSCCVIDEGFGRRICALFGLPLIGSVGIINELRRLGLISRGETSSIRRRLRRSSFYLSRELLRGI